MEVWYLLGPLSDSSRQHFGTLSGTPSFVLEFDLEHKKQGHIRFQRPKLDI